MSAIKTQPENLLGSTKRNENINFVLNVDGIGGSETMSMPVTHHDVPHAHAAHHAAGEHTTRVAGKEWESETKVTNKIGERLGAVRKTKISLKKTYTGSGHETSDNITKISCCTDKSAASWLSQTKPSADKSSHRSRNRTSTVSKSAVKRTSLRFEVFSLKRL